MYTGVGRGNLKGFVFGIFVGILKDLGGVLKDFFGISQSNFSKFRGRRLLRIEIFEDFSKVQHFFVNSGRGLQK
jgi:hypothetical protein